MALAALAGDCGGSSWQIQRRQRCSRARTDSAVATAVALKGTLDLFDFF